MKCKKSIALISGLVCFVVGFCQQVHLIPKQTFQPYKVLGFPSNDLQYALTDTTKRNFNLTIDSFEISSQITFKQYKLYLKSVKKDFSYSFYLSQLPDSNITSKENYAIYTRNKKYDKFPVLGISWAAAMNYCKWRTLQENQAAGIKFIYRLPKISEWLAAYDFLEKRNSINDFSKHFSDWTMSLYYEGAYGFKTDSSFAYDVSYLHKLTDHARDKRKIVIGNSYLFQNEKLLENFKGYFAFEGYRQIAFRLVKEWVKDSNNANLLFKNILTYWDIETNTIK